MADDAASHTLFLLRRLDEKVDNLTQAVGELQLRMPGVEHGLVAIRRDLLLLERRLDGAL